MARHIRWWEGGKHPQQVLEMENHTASLRHTAKRARIDLLSARAAGAPRLGNSRHVKPTHPSASTDQVPAILGHHKEQAGRPLSAKEAPADKDDGGAWKRTATGDFNHNKPLCSKNALLGGFSEPYILVPTELEHDQWEAFQRDMAILAFFERPI
ncbi:hypothetical protein Bbelb_334710, partial [Branchiostoma belcheri]